MDHFVAVVASRATAETPPSRAQEFEAFLRSLDLPENGLTYLEESMARLVQTLMRVPPGTKSDKVLELGAYMQMTPALGRLLEYGEVRGAYFGPLGQTDSKISTIDGRAIFRCEVDLFDVERDRFPYDDGRFQTVLACEIIEHLVLDPMHMLLEIRRVLRPGGTLVLTTPNVTSFTSVSRVLTQSGNPQVYSQYPNPGGEGRESETPHVREYAPGELREAVESAGFEVISLVTARVGSFDAQDVEALLRANGFPGELRGEQMYCIALARPDRPVTRYPSFLYDA
ncbi:MAG: class I SAM-dependent methyltransferase [Actinomycetota bacterium]|nr:class I SAM-dependent methyltransferase [Actinomycetota bacterium]